MSDDHKPTPAAFVLEGARINYPEHAFFVMCQGPDRRIDLATNILNDDLKDFLEDALEIVKKRDLIKLPVPKI